MSTEAPQPKSRLIRMAAAWSVPPLIVCGVMFGMASGVIPPGVPGEWTWYAPRVGLTAREFLAWGLTAAILLSYISIAEKLSSFRSLRAIVLISLFPATAAIQIGWHMAAPESYGLAKWPIATYNSGSSGYFTIANDEIDSLSRFLKDYPRWIATQDVLHIGTHPPGLFVEAKGILDFWSNRPALASEFLKFLPNELTASSRALTIQGPPPAAVQASVISIAIVHWLACAMTVWPLYATLRRLGNSEKAAFRIAAIWCVVPSAILFQPASDVAFPLLTATAVCLSIVPAEGSRRFRHRVVESILAGLVLALGMFLSLVFLAVGLIVALVVMTTPGLSVARRFTQIVVIGIGFLAGTFAWAIVWNTDPVAIWLINQAKHAEFYAAYPRSYFPWLLADMAETAVGLGLPVFFLCSASLAVAIVRREPIAPFRAALCTTMVLVVLAVSGRSLSEVGRLWLPFYPLLLTAFPANRASTSSPLFHRWVLIWTALQLFWLQSLVQCVYPV